LILVGTLSGSEEVTFMAEWHGLLLGDGAKFEKKKVAKKSRNEKFICAHRIMKY